MPSLEKSPSLSEFPGISGRYVFVFLMKIYESVQTDEQRV